ncbi:sugar ABC transporter permease [Siculibacillus lacustris]|uniref:Sugar ABC transporter permease n=1 Tax=Siculibacillus lacustris TaxID=1549641 RepID=A0A4Q9VUV5_9HYPH|nr:ABC transporter permease [Siculibacillus lacustris]TBW39533.1 sugar ABC transporter permease [Siculibacillus lacustris]
MSLAAPDPIRPVPPGDFLASLAVQRRVISALMIREALTRFGHENLGFFWVMGEPLILTLGVMVVWTFTGGTHGHSIGVIPFVLSGYSLLTLWRHIVFRSVHAMRQNIGLVFHRNIRFLDILVARAILESVGGLAAFYIAYVPLVLLGALEPMEDPLILLSAWILMSWFSFGFGLILAGLTELSEAVERFVGPIMYLSLPVTGSFYMVAWLPVEAQRILAWSPLVNGFEMFRCGLFGSMVETAWDPVFLLVSCIVTTAIGVTLVQYAQKHVRMES